MLVVGEASGDIHGAQLVKALLSRDPTVKVFGVAGEMLEQTEFEALYNVSQLAAMGLSEVMGNLKSILQAYVMLRRVLLARRPSLLVLIDFPEFNLRLAKVAKQHGIPVLYYVSTQIWAWRRGRVRKIARRVDHMAVVFPFEVSFYERYGVKVSFVGHPLLDTVRAHKSRQDVLGGLGLDAAKPTVALLPGSRPREVAYHLPEMLAAAARMREEWGVQFLCVRASTISASVIASISRNFSIAMPIVDGDRYEAINAANLVWTASGTATLETALLGRPMIIVYRLSWLTYQLAKRLVKVDHIGMVNLIASERIVPELVQEELTAERIVEESLLILNRREVREGMLRKLETLRDKLGSAGVADRVAAIALSMAG